MLKSKKIPIKRLRRPFSQYMANTYGVKQHRLAKKAGIEVEPIEVIIYLFGSAILISDVSVTILTFL